MSVINRPATQDTHDAGQFSAFERQLYSALSSITPQNTLSKYAEIMTLVNTAYNSASKTPQDVAICKMLVQMLDSNHSFNTDPAFIRMKGAILSENTSPDDLMAANNFINACLFSRNLAAAPSKNQEQVRALTSILNEASIESQRKGISDKWRMAFNTQADAEAFLGLLRNGFPGMQLFSYEILQNPRWPEGAPFALDVCFSKAHNFVPGSNFAQPPASTHFTNPVAAPASINQTEMSAIVSTTPVDPIDVPAQITTAISLPKTGDKTTSTGTGTQSYLSGSQVFYTPYFEPLNESDNAALFLISAVYNRAMSMGFDASSLNGATSARSCKDKLREFLLSEAGQSFITAIGGTMDVTGWASQEAIFHGSVSDCAYWKSQFTSNLGVARDRANRMTTLITEINRGMPEGKAKLSVNATGKVYFYQVLSPQLAAKMKTEGYDLSQLGYSAESSQQHLNEFMGYLQANYPATYNRMMAEAARLDGANYSIANTRKFMDFMVNRSERTNLAKNKVIAGITEAILYSGDASSSVSRGFTVTSSNPLSITATITKVDSAAGIAKVRPALASSSVQLPADGQTVAIEASFQRTGETAPTPIPSSQIRFEDGQFMVPIPQNTAGKLFANIRAVSSGIDSGAVWQTIEVEAPARLAPPPEPVRVTKMSNVPLQPTISNFSPTAAFASFKLPGRIVVSDDTIEAFGSEQAARALEGIISSIQNSPNGAALVSYYERLYSWINQYGSALESQIQPGKYDEFIAAFRAGDFAAARAFVLPNSPLYNSINFDSNSSSKLIRLSRADLLRLTKRSFETRADVTFNLTSPRLVKTVSSSGYDELAAYGFTNEQLAGLTPRRSIRATSSSKSYAAVKNSQGDVSVYEIPSLTGALNVYIRENGYLLITGDNVNVATAGATLLCRIPLAGGLRVEPRLDAAFQHSFLSEGQNIAITDYPASDSLIITPGARIQYDLNQHFGAYLEGILAATFNKNSRASIDPGAVAGLRATLWKGSDANIYANLDVLGFGLRQHLLEQDQTFIKEISLTAGVEAPYKVNVEGYRPLTFRGGFGIRF